MKDSKIKRVIRQGGMLIAGVPAIMGLAAISAHALTPPSDFALQVSPSPLVATVKPGEPTDLDLTIRNNGSGTEDLKISQRKFTIDKQTGQVNLEDNTLPEIADYISFSKPTFTVKPGEVAAEKVHIQLPKDAGFSYSLALVISRADNTQTVKSGNLIKGSVAVFTLLNVDRPGAVRKVDVTDFKATQGIYEYLPAKFNISFKNTGNTILQPYGNVFIQRGSDDKTPVSTIPVNNSGGYLLPDSPRTLTTEWDDGFPGAKTINGVDGQATSEQTWDWSKLSDFRIGPYTAKLVATYNDGQHDVPIIREVTFWVIPWKVILGLLVIIGLIIIGAWTVMRKSSSVVSRRRRTKETG